MSTVQSPRDANTHTPSIEALQKDIELANTYRLEKQKTMLTITTALLAFTVSFRPKLTPPVHFEWAMVMGWVGLSIALIAGVATLQAWEQFYISYRDYDWKGKHEDGKSHRRKVTGWRRTLFAFQCIGFLVGIVGVGLFAAANIGNVQVTNEALGDSRD
jgi:hypothetical protein